MSKIAVLYCKRIKDHSCIACAKCYKGMAETNGEFARHDEIDLVGMTDCGDCPGLTVPRVKLLERDHQGARARDRGAPPGHVRQAGHGDRQCPIDFDELKPILENKFGIEVVLGTHTY